MLTKVKMWTPTLHSVNLLALRRFSYQTKMIQAVRPPLPRAHPPGSNPGDRISQRVCLVRRSLLSALGLLCAPAVVYSSAGPWPLSFLPVGFSAPCVELFGHQSGRLPVGLKPLRVSNPLHCRFPADARIRHVPYCRFL